MGWRGNRLRDLPRSQRRRILADIADESLANISSIVVHLKRNGKTILLTGDARGDNIRQGLARAGLVSNGKTHVNVLKVQHHGSSNNSDSEFFESVTADHYIFSGDRDGTGSNPDKATIVMLQEARGSDEYTMHFSNFDSDIIRWLERDHEQNTRNYDFVFPQIDDHGIWVDLEEELWF